MKFQRRVANFIFIMLISLFVACSSGGGEGGTGYTDVSRGAITEFGSIFVNGVEFDTTNADINLDGLAGTDTDLKLNMIVTVYGSINPDGLTGVAQSIVVKEVITGMVEAKPSSDTVVVLGHTIEILASTRFDNVADLSGIMVGDTVEVSGFVKSGGVITANRVEKLAGSVIESKIFGVVQNLNTTAQSFEFGSLTINYSSAVFSGLSSNSLANDMFLEVKGVYSPSTMTLLASEIEKDSLSTESVEDMAVEGFVTSVTSPTEFAVDYIPVVIDVSTVIDGGDVNEIVVGALVEAEGALVNGVLTANEIEFKDDIRIEALVNTVDTVSSSLTFTGLPGLVVQANSFTEYSGDLPAGLGSINAGTDVIKIRGYRLGATSTIIARRIELSSPTTTVSIQGQVSAIMPTTTFDILGTTIDTSTILDADFTRDSLVLGRAGFFSNLAVDDVVEVVGNLSGSVITWQSAEISD